MAEALDERRWADIADAAVGQQRRKDALDAIADLTHGFPMRAQLEALSDAADAALDHLQAMLNVTGTFGNLPLAEDHRRLRVLADEAGRLGVQVGQLRQRLDDALDAAGVPPTVQAEATLAEPVIIRGVGRTGPDQGPAAMRRFMQERMPQPALPVEGGVQRAWPEVCPDCPSCDCR